MKLRRLRLSRRDTEAVYLDRWGIETRFGGVYLHKFTAPDPGLDMHDHPFVFWSFILKGGYTERVCESWRKCGGHWRKWERWSWHRMDLDECHQIVNVANPTWTLILRGPRVQQWGFYTPDGFVPNELYSGERRDMYIEGNE
jgi:hypothetical protein